MEKLSRIWQHCDALGVSLTLDGAKDEGATRRPGRKTESGFAVEVGGGTGMGVGESAEGTRDTDVESGCWEASRDARWRG